MDVGVDAGAAKAGHGEARVGTTRQGGARAVESGWEVEVGGSGPGEDNVTSSGSEVGE